MNELSYRGIDGAKCAAGIIITGTEYSMNGLLKVSPARIEECKNCVYADVVVSGKEYCLQISRPRHPSKIGLTLSRGADIHTDEGHDANKDFSDACEAIGIDWSQAVKFVVTKSRARGQLRILGV